MTRIVSAAAVLVALAAPAHARNIINWQCGDDRVTLSVNKDTNPYSYDITFEEVRPGKIVRPPGAFQWNTDTYVATLNGKRCNEIPELPNIVGTWCSRSGARNKYVRRNENFRRHEHFDYCSDSQEHLIFSPNGSYDAHEQSCKIVSATYRNDGLFSARYRCVAIYEKWDESALIQVDGDTLTIERKAGKATRIDP